MITLACALTLLIFSPQPATAPQTIGTVASTYDKKVDFSKFRTYAWEKGHEAYDPTAHKIIVDAAEAKMTALGFTKVAAGKADVGLRYHAVRGSDIDLKLLEKLQKEGRPEAAAAATRMLGTLVVVLYTPGGTTPVWEAHTRSQLNEDASKRAAEIQSAVNSLFDTYPGLKKK